KSQKWPFATICSAESRITNHESPFVLVADRAPIHTRVRTTVKDAILNEDGLRSSPGFHLPHLPNGVAARGECRRRLDRKPRLHPQLGGGREGCRIRAGETEPPGPFDSLLNRQPSVNNVGEHLRVP